MVGQFTLKGNIIFMPTEPINKVIGDISYIHAFQTMPHGDVDENLRIKTHLKYVEKTLRSRKTVQLSTTQKANRAKLLDLLHEYWKAGQFPKNHYFTSRMPVFLDRSNNVCAVGYLVQQTVGHAVVEEINEHYKFASIYDINTPVLKDWIAQSGLTIDECAMIQPTYGGGNIIIEPQPRSRPRPIAGMFQLQIQSTQINTKITGQAATTMVDQVFYNPTRNQLQGFYYFPIPKNASIDKFSMYINGKETHGELLSADKARQIYESIVRRVKDPALLEFYNQKLFRVRIFPIRPQSTQRVKLAYTESLNTENGTIEYAYPIGHKQNAALKKVPQLSFKIEVNGIGEIKNLYSPTHNVEINRKGDDQAIIGFEGKDINAFSTFKLYYNTDNSKVGLSMLNYNDDLEKGYFFLNLSPGMAENEEVINKDITFVLDASGSMAGEKMEQAKKALQFCVANLHDNDRFNIVRFSTEATTLFDGLNSANAVNRKKARTYIKALRPIGGTNIDEALEQALKVKTQKDRPYFVIFMTDGKPTIGETNEAALLQKVKNYNPKNTRIFTFGIGAELNTHLLDKITAMTEAYRTYVLPEEDIELKLSDFYTKVASPILTNIEIDFDRNVTQVQPKALPDLFKGSTLTILGRYNGHGTSKITVKGKVNGKAKTYTYTVNFDKKNEKHEFIPALWASRTVGYLLDQIRLNGQNKELIDEVVRLSKRHGIITPYTSYLIIEDEAISLRNNRITRNNQLIRSRVSSDESFVQERTSTYRKMKKKKAGRANVKTSTETQDLNQIVNVAESRTAKKELEYKDKKGNKANLTDGIQNVQGRAFYNNDNVWVDSQIPQKQHRKLKVNRVQFNSKGYFDLLKNDKRSVPFLALGKNVRFVLDDKIYEVFE